MFLILNKVYHFFLLLGATDFLGTEQTTEQIENHKQTMSSIIGHTAGERLIHEKTKKENLINIYEELFKEIL